MTQLALIPGLPSAGSASSAVKSRGRGATPVIELEWVSPERNAVGRRKLNFVFRPLARHQVLIDDPRSGTRKEAWRVACNLLCEYFQAIGGFRTAGDAAVRAWADAVLKYGVASIRQAIAAKAASLRAELPDERQAKRIFVPRPDRFAAPEILEHWITQGAETSAAPAESEGARRLREAKLRDRLNGLRRETASSSLIPHPSSAPQSAADLREQRLANAAHDRAHNDVLWSRLQDVQRRVIARQCLPGFDELVRTLFGQAADPHDPRYDDLQREYFVHAALRKWNQQMLR